MLPHAGTGKVLIALMYNKAPYGIHAVEYLHVAISHCSDVQYIPAVGDVK